MKKHECRHSRDVAAFVGGELPPSSCREFEGHLAGCDSCRLAVDEVRRVVSLLKAVPEYPVTSDLVPGVLAGVGAPRRGWDSGWWRGVAAAAGLAVLVGWWWWVHHAGGAGRFPPVEGVGLANPTEAATEWLCATQEADGSWSTERWGGRPQFEVALTGLALMALLEAEHPTDRTRDAARRATDYLVGRQDAAGRLGPVFDGEPYNQGIATLALARAFQLRPAESLRGVLDLAVRRIEERQRGDGGWGYEKSADESSNLSISLWQIEALRLAASLGWTSAGVSVGRGLKWMTRIVADNGVFGYRRKGDFPEGNQTLTAMGAVSLFDGAHAELLSPERARAVQMQVRKLAATGGPDMDYYRLYFLAAALRKMSEESTSGNLASIRRDLVARQVDAGAERGSWPADDRWSSAGGRVYATALAALSLKLN